MPADALEPDGIPGGMGGGSRITTAVGNAAVYGDDFKWHIDMDPCALSPSSPFAERYGLYVNRSAGRPLFVSALVYLNGPGWTPDMNAETLVLDPGTGTGVFIRPAPGRVPPPRPAVSVLFSLFCFVFFWYGMVCYGLVR